MNLGHIISRLLQDNETVIIPGFGAFVSTYKPAHIDEESEQILPPSKEISFNQKIRNNDGLLVSFLTENEGISHFEALQQIEKERERIVYQLDKGEKIILENTGVLFYDEYNTVQFEPYETENLLLDAFGLDAAEFRKYSDKGMGEEETNNLNLNESENAVTKEPEFAPVEPLKDWRLKVPEKKENRKKGWLWILIIVIPLIAVGVFMLLKPNKKLNSDTTEFQTEKNLDQNKNENNDIAVSDTLKNDSVRIAKEADGTLQKDSGQNKIAPGISGETKYYLIGGSFKEEQNANEYFRKLKKMGYEPFHLGKKGNFFLVGINIYNSEKEALKEQRLFLENNPGSGAWVYIE